MGKRLWMSMLWSACFGRYGFDVSAMKYIVADRDSPVLRYCCTYSSRQWYL